MAQTKLDRDTTKPSVTQPGDGPADTTDPRERAHTITAPTPGPEALAVGTVNAVVPGTPLPEGTTVPKDQHRIEEYDAIAPNGDVVRVQHNLETGETRVKKTTSTDTGATPTQTGR